MTPDPLPDVRTVPLSELLARVGDRFDALGHAARRLAAAVAQPQDALAAFTSYVEGQPT